MHTHLRACVCEIRRSSLGRTILTSRESHKTYVLFSPPSLSLPMRWLSYAVLYNLVTWCHVKKVRWRTFLISISSISGNNW
jgi:hypothetical protein